MTIIEISTPINAPIAHCFDLARSIDLHMASTRQTGERAIAGRMCGLIELGETVTWRAKHLGVWQKLTVKITEFEYPNYFTDEMTRGAFKSMLHQHLFYAIGNQTVMKDIFAFESPLGAIGRWVNDRFLGEYMERFLMIRNELIKQTAEDSPGL